MFRDQALTEKSAPSPLPVAKTPILAKWSFWTGKRRLGPNPTRPREPGEGDDYGIC